MKLQAGLRQRPWGRSAPAVFCVCRNAEESREEKKSAKGWREVELHVGPMEGPPRIQSDNKALLFIVILTGFIKEAEWASLVAQWLRICLLMQETRVRALVWEDPTCRGATRPVSHNY